MAHQCHNEEEEDIDDIKLDEEYKLVTQKLKAKMLEKLQDYDWLEEMRLKCRSYIKNNGTKTTSADEVYNQFIIEAIKSFPQPVREEISDDIIHYLEELDLISHLVRTKVTTADNNE